MFGIFQQNVRTPRPSSNWMKKRIFGLTALSCGARSCAGVITARTGSQLNTGDLTQLHVLGASSEFRYAIQKTFKTFSTEYLQK